MKLHRSGPWIGVTGVVVMLWMTIATVVFAPWWGVLLYVIAWLTSVVVVAKLARSRPKEAMYVPVAGLLTWFAISTAGALWWGWGS